MMMIAQIALQIILGLVFLFTGTIKFGTLKEKLASKGVTGFENISPQWIKTLALTEITGALVLLIFSFPGFPLLPVIVIVIGFALLMIAASYHHLKRKEYKNKVVTLFLLAACVLIWVLSSIK
ncbi:DoxX family protein [Algoriphagus namhaensis]